MHKGLEATLFVSAFVAGFAFTRGELHMVILFGALAFVSLIGLWVTDGK